MPALHVAVPFMGVAQTVPHAPQFAGSLSSARQLPEHAEYPESHCTAHLPALQIAPPCAGTGQAWPQAPQFAALPLRSTHADEHAVVPVGQSVTHLPCEQTSELEQLTPHPPQLCGSLAGWTHAPPQGANPLWHTNVH
jgi:hypothetical protein